MWDKVSFKFEKRHNYAELKQNINENNLEKHIYTTCRAKVYFYDFINYYFLLSYVIIMGYGSREL